jgi:hypothetical protein
MAIFVAVFFVVGMDTHDDRRCCKNAAQSKILLLADVSHPVLYFRHVSQVLVGLQH